MFRSLLLTLLSLVILPIGLAMEFFDESWPESITCNYDTFDKLTLETAIGLHWRKPEKFCRGPAAQYPKPCTYVTDEPWGKKNQTLKIYVHYERLRHKTGKFKAADWKVGHHVGKTFVVDHQQVGRLSLFVVFY